MARLRWPKPRRSSAAIQRADTVSPDMTSSMHHDLERGTDALAYVDAYADIETFHRRDAARLARIG